MCSPAAEKAPAKMGRKGQRIKGLLDSCPGDNDLLIGSTCPFNVHHRYLIRSALVQESVAHHLAGLVLERTILDHHGTDRLAQLFCLQFADPKQRIVG